MMFHSLKSLLDTCDWLDVRSPNADETLLPSEKQIVLNNKKKLEEDHAVALKYIEAYKATPKKYAVYTMECSRSTDSVNGTNEYIHAIASCQKQLDDFADTCRDTRVLSCNCLNNLPVFVAGRKHLFMLSWANETELERKLNFKLPFFIIADSCLDAFYYLKELVGSEVYRGVQYVHAMDLSGDFPLIQVYNQPGMY